MIGITNNGDPTMDLSWMTKTDECDMVVLTTKNPGAFINTELEPAIFKIKDKLILECCVTGYGKSIIEPNVPSTLISIMMIAELVNKGYNIVININPIILTTRGLDKVKSLIEGLRLYHLLDKVSFKYGFLVEYPHFTKRLISISEDAITEDAVHNYFKSINVQMNTLIYDNTVELLEKAEQCYFRCSYCYHEIDYDMTQDMEQIGLI